MIKSKNMRMMLMDVKHYGLEGFEPYSDQAAPYLGKPLELKKLAQDIGVRIASVGDLPVRPALPAQSPRRRAARLSLAGRQGPRETDCRHGGLRP